LEFETETDVPKDGRLNLSFRTLTKNTARVCDYGKNYRLQDIQFSKIVRGKYRPAEFSSVAGRFPPDPLGSLTRVALTSRRSVRSP
jgi:hypothetical protein